MNRDVRKHLELSTANLPPSDWKILEDPKKSPLSVYSHPEGWGAFVWVTDDIDDQLPYWTCAALSEHFERVMRFARDHNVDYILFGRSVVPSDPRTMELPTFDQVTGKQEIPDEGSGEHVQPPLFSALEEVKKFAEWAGPESGDPV